MSLEWLFNFGSWGYDLITNQSIWHEQIAEVLDYVDDIDAVGRVLDLGCGPGGSAFVLGEALPYAEIVGIDIAAKMVDRARAHHRRHFSRLGNVHFEVADATETSFEDGSFDLAVGHSFLYLVPDQRAVLTEVRRVLRPGGTLVLMEPNRRGSLRRATLRRFDLPTSDAPLWDQTMFGTSMLMWRLVSGSVGRLDPDEVEGWMREVGFDEAAVTPTLGGLGMHCVGRVAD